MQFMMLLKANPDYEAGKMPDPRLMAAVAERSSQAQQAGNLIVSGGLLPSSAGVRVNVANGKVSVTDGPFAETRELVGGFAIMEAKSREEAIEMAKSYMQMHADILGPAYEGQLEVRQLMNAQHFEEHGAAGTAARRE